MKTFAILIFQIISLLIITPMVYFCIHIFIDNYLIGMLSFGQKIDSIDGVFTASGATSMIIMPTNILFFAFPLSLGLLLRALGDHVSRFWSFLPASIVMLFYVMCGLYYSKSLTYGLVVGAFAVLFIEYLFFRWMCETSHNQKSEAAPEK